MKRLQKITALFLVVLLFAAMVPTVSAAKNDKSVVFTEVNETVRTTSAVNVRSGPGTNFKKMGMLSRGETIRRIGIGNNGWSKVVYKGKTAYMFSTYLAVSKSSVTTSKMDYSELNRQIAIANGLKEVEYTEESWEALADALARALKALKSNNQKTVDKRTDTLEAAITALVKVNRSALENALEAAGDFIADGENNKLWLLLAEAVNSGKALLYGNDQAAIDTAATQIEEILAEVKAAAEKQNTPEIITQEVFVEVPPKDDYCNIPAHRVWPVLFFCSLVLNVALVALIVIYFYRKKKYQNDDTPLVDYDIADDIF